MQPSAARSSPGPSGGVLHDALDVRGCDVPDEIAHCAMKHYASLPTKGKPVGPREWTVMAAFVLEDTKAHTLQVVSIASGTQCAGADRLRSDGVALHDSHAEVLAKRALVGRLQADLALLMTQERDGRSTQSSASAASHHSAPDVLLLEQVPLSNIFCDQADSKGEGVCRSLDHTIFQSNSPEVDKTGFDSPDSIENFQYRYQLRSGCKLHLYTSAPPCGDSSIYQLVGSGARGEVAQGLHDSTQQVEGLACGVDSVISSSTTTHFTGAKIASQWEKEHVQALGRARSKPGRSDLPPSRRTLSLSCTDKVCRWILLGLQGALLSRWVAPVLLSSVVVSADPRSTPAAMEQALDRAVVERCKAVFANSAALKVLWGSQTIGGCSWAVPTASVCSNQFTRSLSSVEMALQASSEGKRDGSGEVCVDMGLAGRDLEEGQGLNSRICYVAGGAVKSTEELPPTSSVREVEQIVTSDNRKRVKTRHATGFPLPHNMAREKSTCASPLAMNWHRIAGNKQGSKGDGVEVTLGATGLRHGMTSKDRSKAWSRVSRAAQFSAYVRLRLSIPECVGFRISGEVAGNGVVETVDKMWDYSDCKRSDVPLEYQQALAEFKAHPQFSGWLSLSESKQEWTGPCSVLCMLDPTPGTC